MKNRLSFYPIIRREFSDIQELADLLNRSYGYCKKRMNGKETFTHRERQQIADYLKIDISEVIA